jgi:hypothetical protein
MATFGTIASAAPNVLYDASKVDAAVQGFQRNQLMIQSGQQEAQDRTAIRALGSRLGQHDEGALGELTAINPQMGASVGASWDLRQTRAAEGFERDMKARIAVAQELAGLPEADAAGLWSQRRTALQAAGLGKDMPEQFPGTARIRALAEGGIPYAQRLQQQALQSALGMGTPAATPVSMSSPMPTVGAAPVSGGGVRAQNLDATQQRQHAMDTMQGPELEAELARISSGAAQALTGIAPGTQYRASEGTNGVYAGVAPPRPGVPVLGSGQAPATQASALMQASAPAAQQAPSGRVPPMLDGLTPQQQQQIRILATAPGATLASVTNQADEWRYRNQTTARQAAQDERQARLDADKAARDAPGGPIRGDGLNNSLMNILLTGNPDSAEYAAAYARLGAEEFNPATGTARRPDMSPYRAPTYRPPGAEAAAPTGGREYGRADVTPGNQPSPQAREAVRKAETEAGRVTGAIDRFQALFTEQGGGSINAYLNNPSSPQAQQLLAAYEGMKATMRGEAFLNTGVLQPAEAKMLDDVLLSPQSLRGMMATPEAMKARLAEFKNMINRGVQQQRANAGVERAPEAGGSIAGPNGQGYASPPPSPGSRPPLSSFRR